MSGMGCPFTQRLDLLRRGRVVLDLKLLHRDSIGFRWRDSYFRKSDLDAPSGGGGPIRRNSALTYRWARQARWSFESENQPIGLNDYCRMARSWASFGGYPN